VLHIQNGGGTNLQALFCQNVLHIKNVVDTKLQALFCQNVLHIQNGGGTNLQALFCQNVLRIKNVVDTKLQALFCQNVLHIQNDKIPICKLYFDGLFHIGIFQMLLPKGCCRSVLHSDEYQESYQCNFLGLSAQGSLPNHICTTEMFVLLVELHLKDENDKPQSDNDFGKFEFKMASTTKLLEKGKQYLYE
jgi:hypothetical protein